MKICLDVRYKTDSGASSYIKNIIPAILRIDHDNQYVILKNKNQSFEFEPQLDGVWVCPVHSNLLQLVWATSGLPLLLKKNNIELYHGLKMPGPLWTSSVHVITMHSIVTSYKGDFPVNLRTKLFIMFYLNLVLHRADYIVAVSNFITDCLRERHNVSEDRIIVSYHGIESSFEPLPKEREPKSTTYNLPPTYILCVGNVTRVKNHLTAVRAFAKLADKVTESLVIAGSTKDPYFLKVRDEARRSGLSDRVLFLGFVNRADLAVLMNGAKILLFPSLTEGCPVTMLEAFGCGLPVVASKRGGLWDLGKDTAIFVDDPFNADAFSKQVLSVLKNEDMRRSLSAKALEHARSFSWETAAKQHVALYKNALNSKQ